MSGWRVSRLRAEKYKLHLKVWTVVPRVRTVSVVYLQAEAELQACRHLIEKRQEDEEEAAGADYPF